VFLTDGRLVTADRGRAVRVWNVAARTTDRTWQVGPGGVTELAAHPTRNWVAAAGRNFVEVWDADTGERVRRLAGANRVGFSPCGRWAATADRAAARVWALPGWEPKWELTGHTASVSSLAFSPDGERLLTGSLDGGVRTWDLSTGEAIGTPWKRPRPVVGLAFTPDGQALIEAHPEGIVVADPKTGRHQHRVEPTAAGRSFLAVGPTAGWVGVIGPDREVVVWDVSRRRPVRVFRGHTAPVTALAFSRDGRQLASAGVDPAVRIWDTTRDADVRTLAEPGDWAGGLAVAPDGSRLAVGPRFNGSPADHRVLILDAATGRERRRLAAAGDVAFHPDSRRLATGRPGGGVMLWDAETGAALWNSPAPEGRREAGPRGCRMAFSPEGSWLAVWPGRGGVQLLDAESGSDAGTVDVGNEFVYAIGFSTDGTRMAVATAGELVLWDVLCRSKLPRTEPARGAVAVAHSPDGRQLVSADRDRVVRHRVAATGKPIREFIGGATQVNAVAFSPDGTRIVTGGSDGTVRVWDAETGRELLALPGVTGPVVGVAWDRAHDRILALDDALRGWSRDGW
jgi:WD40 repeat protein